MPEPDTHARPILTVDLVPLTLAEGKLAVLCARRDKPPYAGMAALVGGYVRLDEDADLDASARRILREKVGLPDLYVEQLATFSGPSRDPRGWSASVAYFSVTPAQVLAGALERPGFALVPVDDAKGLAFDHDAIVAAAAGRMRGKGAYSDLPARLLPPPFTLAQLHGAYEAALGQTLNRDGFRRKVMERAMLEATGERRRAAGANKPSALYRLKGGTAVFDRRV